MILGSGAQVLGLPIVVIGGSFDEVGGPPCLGCWETLGLRTCEP
jgi:hypothetical protein